MDKKIATLKDLEQGVLGLHAQMLVVRNLINSAESLKMTKEDIENSELKRTMSSITSILEDCNTIFTKDIY